MRRAIFLDIDGVLVNSDSARLPRSSRAAPTCVSALNSITDATGANIVVSSAWRLDFSLDELRDYFRTWGITGDVVDVTCQHDRCSRVEQIQSWLEANGPLAAAVIIDDDHDMGALASCLVRTNPEFGLTDDGAERAIALLNRTWS